jgi:hypothetical protein
MNKYWFGLKKYGWGPGFPVSWEGWLVTVIILTLILIIAYVDGIFYYILDLRHIFRFLIDSFLTGTAIALIFADKIKDGLKWRWGQED